eukprot:GHVL01040049.1.p1 GENE.GHVL01040049.1~~GHVL01040049.1.p1  ORF type:complete len:428 (+),score=114.59 GHVL01040049.1:127-1284(+)
MNNNNNINNNNYIYENNLKLIILNNIEESAKNLGSYKIYKEVISDRNPTSDTMEEDFKKNIQKLRQEMSVAIIAQRTDTVQSCLIRQAELLANQQLFPEAIRELLQCQEMCKTAAETLEVLIRILRYLLLSGEITNELLNYASKILKNSATTNKETAITNTALGLHATRNENYKEAFLYFTEACCCGSNSSKAEICTISDTVNLAVFTGIVSLTRSEIEKNMLNRQSSMGKVLVEFTTIRDMVVDFYENNFLMFFKKLSEFEEFLRLDMFMWDCWDHLKKALFQTSITQYFRPYRAIKIARVAESLGCDSVYLENELISLIKMKKIFAKIDSVDKIIYADKINKKSILFKETFEKTDEFLADYQATILRMQIQQLNLTVTKTTNL